VSRTVRCNRWMPDAQARCARFAGHAVGYCRTRAAMDRYIAPAYARVQKQRAALREGAEAG